MMSMSDDKFIFLLPFSYVLFDFVYLNYFYNTRPPLIFSNLFKIKIEAHFEICCQRIGKMYQFIVHDYFLL